MLHPEPVRLSDSTSKQKRGVSPDASHSHYAARTQHSHRTHSTHIKHDNSASLEMRITCYANESFPVGWHISVTLWYLYSRHHFYGTVLEKYHTDGGWTHYDELLCMGIISQISPTKKYTDFQSLILSKQNLRKITALRPIGSTTQQYWKTWGLLRVTILSSAQLNILNSIYFPSCHLVFWQLFN